jgi:hypothetical protein
MSEMPADIAAAINWLTKCERDLLHYAYPNSAADLTYFKAEIVKARAALNATILKHLAAKAAPTNHNI